MQKEDSQQISSFIPNARKFSRIGDLAGVEDMYLQGWSFGEGPVQRASLHKNEREEFAANIALQSLSDGISVCSRFRSRFGPGHAQLC